MKQPELIVIDTVEHTELLIEYVKQFDLSSMDYETTGVTARDTVVGLSVCCERDKAFYVILGVWNVETQALEMLPTLEPAARLLDVLKTQHLVAHNALFEMIMSQAFFKKDIRASIHSCTLLMAHLLDENRKNGLKELAASKYGDSATEEQKLMKASVLKNGGIWQDKPGGNKEMYKADTYLLGRYGAKDAWLGFVLFHDLLAELVDQGLDTFFYEETMPLLRGPSYEMNYGGLKVDVDKMVTLKKQLEAENIELMSYIKQETNEVVKTKYPGTNKKNTFNVGSSQQLAWLLFGVLKLEFGTLTKGGKTACKALGLKLPYSAAAKRSFIHECEKSVGQVYAPAGVINGKKVAAKKFKEPWAYIETNKKILGKYAKKITWVESLLKYQANKKLLTTYVDGMLARINYGIIQPSFLANVTPTGRYSSRNPNFQNLPRKDKRIKACVVSRPGRSFVGADFSQLEPRVFAFISKDVNLMNTFTSGADFYSVVGIPTFNVTDATPMKEGSDDAFGVKYPELRDLSKVVALSSPYGTTASQLASSTGKTADEMQSVIDRYFEEFPLVHKWMLDSHEIIKKEGVIYSMFGRPRRLPAATKIEKIYGKKAHAEYDYATRRLLNQAVNFQTQSGGASICNRAMIKFHESCKEAGVKDCYTVMQVHDEIIAECNDADAPKVAELLRHAMETAVGLPGVPLEAVPKIAKNLADLK